MTERPQFDIFEIQRLETGEFVLPENQQLIRLSAEDDPEMQQIENRVNSMLNQLKDMADRFFVISWEGSRVPRGAMIDEHEIAWTQNGRVLNSQGKAIGYYDRIIDCGSETGTKQQMLVYYSSKLAS